MKILFRKTILSTLSPRLGGGGVLRLLAIVIALGLTGMPLVSASAAGEYNPPVAQGQITNARLERVWARQLRIYRRMGRTDEIVERVQKLMDRAKENGKDVSGVEAALQAFKAAAKDAQPIYESMEGIVNSHQGFDTNGKVTNREKAKETVKAMHEKFTAIRETMNSTGKALHQAIKAFREANPHPQQTPTPMESNVSSLWHA